MDSVSPSSSRSALDRACSDFEELSRAEEAFGGSFGLRSAWQGRRSGVIHLAIARCRLLRSCSRHLQDHSEQTEAKRCSTLADDLANNVSFPLCDVVPLWLIDLSLRSSGSRTSRDEASTSIEFSLPEKPKEKQQTNVFEKNDFKLNSRLPKTHLVSSMTCNDCQRCSLTLIQHSLVLSSRLNLLPLSRTLLNNF